MTWRADRIDLASAVFSDCGRYRYCLERRFPLELFVQADRARTLAFVMLNPSTADAHLDDPTIRRCIDTALRSDYQRLIVVNLFAWRATDPDVLKDVADPIGPDNDAWIKYAASEAETVICAWGNNGGGPRAGEVYDLIRSHAKVYRLGALTKKGQPSHPLYLSKSLQWESMRG